MTQLHVIHRGLNVLRPTSEGGCAHRSDEGCAHTFHLCREHGGVHRSDCHDNAAACSCAEELVEVPERDSGRGTAQPVIEQLASHRDEGARIR